MWLCRIIFYYAHKLLCEDSDSGTGNDVIVSTKAIRAIHYAVMHNFCYLYSTNSYHANVRGRRSGYDMPEWKKINLECKYNDKEMLQFFWSPRHLLLHSFRMLKGHPAFSPGKNQRKHFSAELHLLMLQKVMVALSFFWSMAFVLVKALLWTTWGELSMQCYHCSIIQSFGQMLMSTMKEVIEFVPPITFWNVFRAIDGTHLGAAVKPELDGEEHFTHKQNYAVAATLVCDDHKRIWYIVIYLDPHVATL